MSEYDLENGIFSKIVRGEIPADIVFQDEWVTAFCDIQPQAPVHVLVIPNKCIPTVNHLEVDDEALVGKLFLAAKKIAKDLGVAESGYRLIMNCLDDGGQEVYHIHLHLLGGERLGPLRSR